MSVIRHDFDKRNRQTVRRFRQLLCLDALHEANVRANPVPYLERASERIFQLEQSLFEAAQAGKIPQEGRPADMPMTDDMFPRADLIEVDKARYEALLHCFSIVEAALAKYGSSTEDFL